MRTIALGVVAVVTVASVAQGQVRPRLTPADLADLASVQSSPPHTCADVMQREKVATTKTGVVRQAYLDSAKQGRSIRMAEEVAKIDASVKDAARFTAEWWAARDDLDAEKADYIAWQNVAIEALEEIRCLDASAVSAQAARIKSESDRIAALLDVERVCRASQSCLTGRWASKVRADACVDIAGRNLAADEIRREKANPSGVVDLVKLHGLGQALQDADARIADAKKAYVAQMHKPFPACPATR
jgi:hypothetical protein